MLEQSAIGQAATALYQAEKNRTQIDLLSLTYPTMDIDDAYLIQGALVANKLAQGLKQTGWKIGLTSKVMQNALAIDTPDSGVLFDTMHFASGATIPKDRFIQPRIEAEIAFIMKSEVADASEQAILDATDYVVPSLEILDTRILRSDPKTKQVRTVVDTISDNASNAGVVLGNARHDPRQVDLRWVGAILKRDGVVEETGLGAAVLDHPLTSMSWLVKRLAQYGQKIKAGDVVLSGSFIKPIEAPCGSQFHADFGSFGTVEIIFG